MKREEAKTEVDPASGGRDADIWRKCCLSDGQERGGVSQAHSGLLQSLLHGKEQEAGEDGWAAEGVKGLWGAMFGGDQEQGVCRERGLCEDKHSLSALSWDTWWQSGKCLICAVFVSLSPALPLLAGCP